MCDALLGWDENDTLRLLVGSSPASVAGARALDAICGTGWRPGRAGRCAPGRGRADPVAALTRSIPTSPTSSTPGCTHAWRPTNYEPGSPAIIERPGVVTRLLLQDDAPVDGDVAARAEAEALAQLAEADRGRFVAALEQARRIYPVREENVVLTDNVPCGILRRWVLEAGPRLVGRGRLARASTTPSSAPPTSWPMHCGAARRTWSPSSPVDAASRHGPAPIPVRRSSACSTRSRTSASSPRTAGA